MIQEQNQNTQIEKQTTRSEVTSLASLCQLKAPFTLSPLPYAPEALEPVIDKETMIVHHDKHHKTYVDNLNKFLAEVKDQPNDVELERIFKNIDSYPVSVRNNGGGHWNHSFFWSVLTPDKNKREMPKRLQREIEATFHSLEEFKTQFEKAGTGQFGSGWVWLVRATSGELKICATKNQDNPLMGQSETSGRPIFGVDVWEHAYYLKHHEKRADYLKGIWEAVNWDQVNAYDKEALERIATFQ